jgi:hypothetical protein
LVNRSSTVTTPREVPDPRGGAALSQLDGLVSTQFAPDTGVVEGDPEQDATTGHRSMGDAAAHVVDSRSGV